MGQLCKGNPEIEFVFQPEKLGLCRSPVFDSDGASSGAQFLLHCEISFFQQKTDEDAVYVHDIHSVFLYYDSSVSADEFPAYAE